MKKHSDYMSKVRTRDEMLRGHEKSHRQGFLSVKKPPQNFPHFSLQDEKTQKKEKAMPGRRKFDGIATCGRSLEPRMAPYSRSLGSLRALLSYNEKSTDRGPSDTSQNCASLLEI